MSPIELTLPWAVLVPDNAKYTVTMDRKTRKPKLILSPAYRGGKDTAYLLAKRQIKGGPLVGRLQLHAVVYEPNTSRGRDVANYSKMVHDALEGAAYDNDNQLDRVTWDRGPNDPTNPRVEITISPLPKEAQSCMTQ